MPLRSVKQRWYESDGESCRLLVCVQTKPRCRSCYNSIHLSAFDYFSLLIQTWTLLRHFLKRAIQNMCCCCKWGLFWQDSKTWGSWGKRIPGLTFQGLVVVLRIFPVGKKKQWKEKDFCANRASGHQCNCHFPFRFFFHVSGMVWITVQSVICPFHGCLRPKQALAPSSYPTSSWLQSVQLDTCLTRVRHRAAGCDTQVCDNSLCTFVREK